MPQALLHDDFPEITPKKLGRYELGYLVGIADGLSGTVHRRSSADCQIIGAQMKELISHIAHLEQELASKV
jgi:hypothetical protein